MRLEMSRDPMSTTSMKHAQRRHFFVRDAQAMRENPCRYKHLPLTFATSHSDGQGYRGVLACAGCRRTCWASACTRVLFLPTLRSLDCTRTYARVLLAATRVFTRASFFWLRALVHARFFFPIHPHPCVRHSRVPTCRLRCTVRLSCRLGPVR